MSVMFKALKKLKRSGSEEAPGGKLDPQPTEGENGGEGLPFWKKKPVVIAGAATGVLLLLGGGFFAYSMFQEKAPDKPSVMVADKGTEESVAVPLETAMDQVVVNKENGRGASPNQGAETMEEGDDGELPALELVDANLGLDDHQDDGALELLDENLFDPVMGGEDEELELGGSGDEESTQMAERAPAPLEMPEEGVFYSDEEEPLDDEPMPESEPEVAKQDPMDTVLDHGRQVGDVTRKLHSAIAQHDAVEVSRQFAALENLKKPDDLFLLNMRGYWAMLQGKGDEAESFLKRVLDKRSDDLEAGLNMAIIEFRRGHKKASRDRLHKLLELYPDDPRLPGMFSYFR
ncbi:MAG: tetratricopeptide repeat protein [Magnetococcales bacterium]|nr:tetratricopeptide repeat protein [Magnetococcales bacterium]